jgi:hypothetical protein
MPEKSEKSEKKRCSRPVSKSSRSSSEKSRSFSSKSSRSTDSLISIVLNTISKECVIKDCKKKHHKRCMEEMKKKQSSKHRDRKCREDSRERKCRKNEKSRERERERKREERSREREERSREREERKREERERSREREERKREERERSRESRERSRESREDKCNEEKEKKEKQCRDSSRESNESCDKEFENLYCYMRCKLYNDNSLMIAGSNAFASAFDTKANIIAQSYPVDLTTNLMQHNIKHISFNDPFFVKENGIYVVFFNVSTDQTSQFSIFVNGILLPLTVTGNNSGAGQLINRQLLHLRKNDNVVIRNYLSASSSVELAVNPGGSETTVNIGFLIHKIAPLPEDMRLEECWDEKCLSNHKLALFRKLKAKLLQDKLLMPHCFNVHGSFHSVGAQTVNQGNSFLFESANNVHKLTFVPNTTDIIIQEDGIYKTFFMVCSNAAAQIAFFVNGVALPETINGTNRGAGQLTIRQLLSLKKGDVLTVRNYTSGNSIILSNNAGGTLQGMNMILTMYKMSPTLDALAILDKYEHCDEYKKHCEEKYEEMYCLFRNYLLNKRYLQINGVQNYTASISSTKEVLNIGDVLHFNTVNPQTTYDLVHIPGDAEFIVKDDGIYDIFIDAITDQPAQLTVFVNNIPDNNTIVGRDSGGNRTLLRQFMKLCRHDVITVKNWKSLINPIITSLNPGGNAISQSYSIILYKLSHFTN